MEAKEIYQTHFNPQIRAALRQQLGAGSVLFFEQVGLLARGRFLSLIEGIKPDHSCLTSLSELLIDNGPPVKATVALTRLCGGEDIISRVAEIMGLSGKPPQSTTLLTPEVIKYSQMTARQIFDEMKATKHPAYKILGSWNPREKEPRTNYEKFLEAHAFMALKAAIIFYRAKNQMPLPCGQRFYYQN